jgi:hypothetical protein
MQAPSLLGERDSTFLVLQHSAERPSYIKQKVVSSLWLGDLMSEEATGGGTGTGTENATAQRIADHAANYRARRSASVLAAHAGAPAECKGGEN